MVLTYRIDGKPVAVRHLSLDDSWPNVPRGVPPVLLRWILRPVEGPTREELAKAAADLEHCFDGTNGCYDCREIYAYCDRKLTSARATVGKARAAGLVKGEDAEQKGGNHA